MAAAVAVGVAQCEDCGTISSEMGLLLGAGVTAWFIGTVDDIVTAPRRAADHDAKLRRVSLMPMLTRGGGGLTLGGEF